MPQPQLSLPVFTGTTGVQTRSMTAAAAEQPMSGKGAYESGSVGGAMPKGFAGVGNQRGGHDAGAVSTAEVATNGRTTGDNESQGSVLTDVSENKGIARNSGRQRSRSKSLDRFRTPYAGGPRAQKSEAIQVHKSLQGLGQNLTANGRYAPGQGESISGAGIQPHSYTAQMSYKADAGFSNAPFNHGNSSAVYWSQVGSSWQPRPLTQKNDEFNGDRAFCGRQILDLNTCAKC
jgi:hypothetical protein